MGIEAGVAMLISAVIGAGASIYAASQQPDAPEAPKAPQIDKTTPIAKDKLKELEDADPGMSKRKKAASKDKFKVNLPDETTGVTTDSGTVQGVQI